VYACRTRGGKRRDDETFNGCRGCFSVLDLTGETRSVATLSGSGTVSNGTIRVTGVLDVGGDVGDIAVMAVKGNVAFATGAGMAVDYLKPAHDRLTISGMLGFDGAGIVTVRLPQEPATGLAGRLPLAVAGSIAGIDNLPSWTIHGLPSAYTGALVVNGSTLYLEIALKGTVMLVK